MLKAPRQFGEPVSDGWDEDVPLCGFFEVVQ